MRYHSTAIHGTTGGNTAHCTAAHPRTTHTQQGTPRHNTPQQDTAQHGTARRNQPRHGTTHHRTTQRGRAQQSRAHRNTAQTRTVQHGKARHHTARRTKAHHSTKARHTNRGSNPSKLPHSPQGEETRPQPWDNATPTRRTPARGHCTPGNNGDGRPTQASTGKLKPAPQRRSDRAIANPLEPGPHEIAWRNRPAGRPST